MARVLVTPQTTPGAYPALQPGAGSLTITFQACDPSLLNYAPLVNGKTYLLAQNTDSGAHTVTITSVADAPFNRTGDITAYSVAAGVVAQFGPFATAGWSNGGQLWFAGNDATIKFAVITLP